MWQKNTILIFACLQTCYSYNHRFHHSHHNHDHHQNNHLKKLEEVFSWKQLSYEINGRLYQNDTDSSEGSQPALADKDKFFIQYDNVPIGLEVYHNNVFVTVPRRRHGIPSTLNYVRISSPSSSAPLKPYPGSSDLVSVYRPRVDDCGRLWMIDTGLLEIPGERKQVQPPAIIVYDLKTNKRILKYELKPTDLVNERTPGGLTSITVDVTPSTCDCAFAYINDLATEGLIVYSMELNDSWRIQHDSFRHDPNAVNFTVAGFPIPWKDGMFSIALSEPDHRGKRVAFYHALASTQEYAVDTDALKNRGGDFGSHVRLLGSRGSNSQSGSHAYHADTKTLLFANVARNAILCWRVDADLAAEKVAVVAQDSEKLVYISGHTNDQLHHRKHRLDSSLVHGRCLYWNRQLRNQRGFGAFDVEFDVDAHCRPFHSNTDSYWYLKVVGDKVWVLVNKIPIFVYSTLNRDERNFYIHRGNIHDLIRGTSCERHHKK